MRSGRRGRYFLPAPSLLQGWLPSSMLTASTYSYISTTQPVIHSFPHLFSSTPSHHPLLIFLGLSHLSPFPGGSDGKESACNAGDPSSTPGLRSFPEERNGNPLQYSCLENLHGQRSLAGYSPWGLKESDTTEGLTLLLLPGKPPGIEF